MSSATCTVDGNSTDDGVDVAGGAAIVIALADTAGVSTWSLTCIYTDERYSAVTVTGDLGIDLVAKTANYAMVTDDGLGAAFIFQSQINGGRDVNGNVNPEYTKTFGIFMLAANGKRIGALNETTEGSAAFGWTAKVNDIIRSAPASYAATATVATPSTIALRGASGNADFGYVRLGAAGSTYATAGLVRLAKNDSIKSRNNGNTADINWLSINSSDNLTLGDTANLNDLTIGVKSASNIYLTAGASNYVQVTSAFLRPFGVDLSWDAADATPFIGQADLATNGATGRTLRICAQKTTGTTSTSGALSLETETGTLANGAIVFKPGQTTALTLNGAATAAAFGSSVLVTGAGTWQEVVKSADQSVTSSTTVVDDTELRFTVGATQTWEMECSLHFTCATAGGARLNISMPAGATGTLRFTGICATAMPSAAAASWGAGAIGSDYMVDVAGTATDIVVALTASITIAGTSGSVKLQFAQQTSNGTATKVKAGSKVRAKRVA